MEPFDLICFECRTTFSSFFNNEPCQKCGSKKEKRWILKPEFKDTIKDPASVTIENFQKNLKFTLEIKL